MKKGVGSRKGTLSQRYGSGDPDPHQNVTYPQHFVRQFEFGGVTRLIRSRKKTGGLESSLKNFIDKFSREEHKIIYIGFRISGMALSNQRPCTVADE
jgi:hypothetical protein